MELLQILVTVTLLHSIPLVVLLPKTYAATGNDCEDAIVRLLTHKVKNAKVNLTCVTARTLYI